MNSLNKISIAVVTLLLPCSILASDLHKTDWDLIIDKDNIRVSTRHVEGSKLIECQGVTQMSTTMEDLVNLVLNTDKCSDFPPNCKTARLVKKYSESKYDIYREIKVPWPFKNRDYLIQYTLAENAVTKEKIIKFRETKGVDKESKCCVRMPMLNGFFKFTPLENKNIEVVYRAHIDVGGGIPDSMLNKSFPEDAIAQLSTMRKILEDPER